MEQLSTEQEKEVRKLAVALYHEEGQVYVAGETAQVTPVPGGFTVAAQVFVPMDELPFAVRAWKLSQKREG